MKKFVLTLGAIALALAALLAALYVHMSEVEPAPQACTEEAMICPDGSAVGRTGPNCAFAACPTVTSTPTPVPTPTPGSTSATSKPIAIGEQVVVGNTTIGVLELLEDSRCPIDVQCIQAGTVRVRAALNSMSRDFTFTLGQPQVVGNIAITLVMVTPGQKVSTQTVAPSAYRFVFTVVPTKANQ